MHRAALLSICLLLPLAGCTDAPEDAPVDDVPDSVDSGRAAEPFTAAESFGWTAAIGIPGSGTDAQFQSTNAAQVRVPDGANVLNVTAEWTCTPEDCTLHGYVHQGDVPTDPLPGEADAHAAGDGLITFTFTDPEPGPWLLALHADNAAATVAGTIFFEVA